MSVAAKEAVEVCDGAAVEGTAESVVAISGPGPTALAAAPSLPSSLSLAHQEAARLQRIENEILERALSTVADSMYWQDIQAGEEEPPRQWVEEMGLEAATRRLRVARAAWMNAKDAPVGLGMARSTMMGILKKNALVKSSSPTLNIQFVNFAQPELDVIDVEAEAK